MSQQHQVMHPTVLLFLLGLIDPKRWGARCRIVQVIGAQEGGDFFSAENLAATVPGIDLAWIRRVLPQLERDQVIFRTGGRGSRPPWCEINPDPLTWRRVPWMVDRGDLARRWMFHAEQQRAAITAEARVVARSWGARQRDFFARSLNAREITEERRLPRAAGARDNRIPAASCRALEERATGEELSRAAGTRGNLAGVPSSSSSSTRSSVSNPPPPLTGGDQEQEEVDTRQLDRARWIVMQRTGAAFLRGKAEDRLAALIARYGDDEVLEVARTMPMRYMPSGEPLGAPRFLEAMGAELAALSAGDQLVDSSDTGQVGEDLVVLAGRIDNLRVRIKTFEELGDVEEVEKLGMELAECENEYQARTHREAS